MLKFAVLSLLIAAVFSAPAPGVLHGAVGPSITASSSSVVHSAALVAPAIHTAPALLDVGVIAAVPASHGLSLTPAVHGATLAAPAIYGVAGAVPELSAHVLGDPALTTKTLHGGILAAPALHGTALATQALTTSHGLYGTAPLALGLESIHGIH